MSHLVSVRTEDLAGPALVWAIETIEGAAPPSAGQLQLAFCAAPADDAQCERLITKYSVWVEPGHRADWVADTKRDPFQRVHGETRAIAVCRAVLAKAIGKTCSVPAELV
ncbi:hypothetical protein AO391_24490 [Pseudomonas marginalis ICMP 9505]|uniref:DUF2591 domain-containing protein n=1 Tax=Pseudomonas kitaguniensis TaxID=2607908 RepID=A0A5N7JSB6_9PSED|nr:hypothetical protein [Pseudomonas kitaguniensis]KTC14482.1 hypothetical protein AO391_24490 [Pseudomonas marginalis ICMP 9505]MPQ84241.1 hypothetical protein [Pseudomonas kitaguniensis]